MGPQATKNRRVTCGDCRLGRNMGVEPIHARFTAECVNRFTNCAVREEYIILGRESQEKML